MKQSIKVVVLALNCSTCRNVDETQYKRVYRVDGSKSLGFGCVLKKFFALFPVKYCAGCAVRRAWLNHLFPSQYFKSLPSTLQAILLQAQRERLPSFPVVATIDTDTCTGYEGVVNVCAF